MSEPPISFGDHVRVRSTEITQQMGLADLIGMVYGWALPSQTGVDVIGEPIWDYAINVHFDNLGKEYWFIPQLLEFVDHAEGTVLTLKGVSKKWTRKADGQWQVESTEANSRMEPSKKKPWWKFW